MKSQAHIQIRPVKEKPKVFVGMSGGVDSSVSAALLKKAGYGVTGVFIKVWQPDWITCTWKEDRLDAMRVAAQLDIPFITLDLEKEYKKEVVDYMIAEYAAGRTPNPDVMCNQHVKFGAFYDWAIKQGADYVATGHYARVKNPPASPPPFSKGDMKLDSRSKSPFEKWGAPKEAGDFCLLTGSDPNKDQSYFLWTLKQEQLARILFPVGDIEKPEVRKLAKKFKLPNADKKDSQGLCFIGKIDMKEFLSHYIQTKGGDVLNEKGEIIGTHSGALFLTIGERHGFTITKKTPHDLPYYVVSKDANKNTITVRSHDKRLTVNDAANRSKVSIKVVNWVSSVPAIGSKLLARSRYRQPLQGIKILSIGGDSADIEFDQPQETLTPGQSLVIYDNDECVGGGIITG